MVKSDLTGSRAASVNPCARLPSLGMMAFKDHMAVELTFATYWDFDLKRSLLGCKMCSGAHNMESTTVLGYNHGRMTTTVIYTVAYRP